MPKSKFRAYRIFYCALLSWGLLIESAFPAELPESVVMVPKSSGIFGAELETTIFRPGGEGPFPIAVINHGKAYGNPRFQNRFRPLVAARFFLARGYAVIVPMRQGFSKSTGSFIDGGCNLESNGYEQALSVEAALDYATAQPWADKNHILVAGQSHGGWTTLAFGTKKYPGVKGLVNFAGGYNVERCNGWEQSLIAGAGTYGGQTSIPSLWFYGDNDSFFPPSVWKGMFRNYTAAGGKARLVAYGNFGNDAHAMFHLPAGAPIWQSELKDFLQEIHMPFDVRPEFAKYEAESPLPPSGFAEVDRIDRLPVQTEAAINGYRAFLRHPAPRAFAISADGGWGSGWNADDPRGRALENCAKKTVQGVCRLYAVDGAVVWPAEQPKSPE